MASGLAYFASHDSAWSPSLLSLKFIAVMITAMFIRALITDTGLVARVAGIVAACAGALLIGMAILWLFIGMIRFLWNNSPF